MVVEVETGKEPILVRSLPKIVKKGKDMVNPY
jgi:hypothetical protein